MRRKLKRYTKETPNQGFWLQGEKELEEKYPNIFRQVCEGFYSALNKNPFVEPKEALRNLFPKFLGGKRFPEKIKAEFVGVYLKNSNKTKVGCC